METIKKGLPSFFTSLGLICGCISIVMSVSGNLAIAGYLILIAAVFDFVDGFIARMLNSISEFGKQLDSLSDVISFGVAPSMIIYRLLMLSYVKSSPEANFDVTNPEFSQSLIISSAFIIAVFSALRLAKFNLDPTQSKNFKGLPVPANALFISALAFAAETSRYFPASDMVFNKFFLLAVILLSSYLLVSDIGMFSLKFSSFSLKKNSIRFVFLLISAILLILFHLPALAPIIVIYIFLSILNNNFVKMQ